MWLVLNGDLGVSSAISFLSVLPAVVSSMEGSTLSVCCCVAVSGIVVILVGVIVVVFMGVIVVLFVGSIVVVFMGSIVVVSDILLTTAAPCAVSTLTDSVVVASACPSPESKVLINFCRSVM